MSLPIQYTWSVELLELRTEHRTNTTVDIDNTDDNIEAKTPMPGADKPEIDHIENRYRIPGIRTYLRPSHSEYAHVMGTGLGVLQTNSEENQKYGISERRINCTAKITTSPCLENYPPFQNLENWQQYSSTTMQPDIITNQSVLNDLMMPHSVYPNTIIYFSAKKLPKGTGEKSSILLKAVFPKKTNQQQTTETTGFIMEDVLATTPKGEADTIHGLFYANLGNNSSRNGHIRIKVALTSEIDGLWYSEELQNSTNPLKDAKIKDLVEVKALKTDLFCSFPNGSPYKYERQVARKNWIQGRLLGLESILYGIVDSTPVYEPKFNLTRNYLLKEIWCIRTEDLLRTLNVEEYSKKPYFPTAILKTHEQLRTARRREQFGKKKYPRHRPFHTRPWTENSCFQQLNAALQLVINEMSGSNVPINSKKYFKYDEAGALMTFQPIWTP